MKLLYFSQYFFFCTKQQCVMTKWTKKKKIYFFIKKENFGDQNVFFNFQSALFYIWSLWINDIHHCLWQHIDYNQFLHFFISNWMNAKTHPAKFFILLLFIVVLTLIYSHTMCQRATVYFWLLVILWNWLSSNVRFTAIKLTSEQHLYII